MSAGHFFVGVGAGIAVLSVPALLLVPGLEVPQRLDAWMGGSVQVSAHATPTVELAGVTRPKRGYLPGEPTPTPPLPPPTLAAITRPTATPRPQPEPPPTGLTSRPATGLRTGVIRSGGVAVAVRRAAGIDSPDDPQLADGSPVLVSVGAELQINGEAWRAVRGLSGVAGWVPSRFVAVDGEAPSLVAASTVRGTPTTSVSPESTSGVASEQWRVANTGGAGVVLRASPRADDRLPAGLMDGALVQVLERAGPEWARVRSASGQEGWVPSRYLAPIG